jgi:hypothetical protein
MRTSIPVSTWLEESDEVIATAVDILVQEQKGSDDGGE